MKTHTVRGLVLIGVLMTIVAAARASGQSGAPPIDPTLAELRAMRADINERLEANIRVQLLLGRLTLQEQRTNTVVRQLSEISEKLRTNEQTKIQIEAGSKMFGFDPNKPVANDDDNFLMATLKAQTEQLAKTEAELKQQHAELTTALAQEQARWAAFNTQLGELERLLGKRK
jgi:hypothetical protein